MEMDVEIKPIAGEFSKEELQRELYSSLRSAGVLDSIKGQLRARMLEHLTHQSGQVMEGTKRQRRLSLTERLLSSLFLDYLECSGFTFTASVFMPESQMDPWPPFSYEEMLELLHLDPSSDLHTRLKLNSGERRECLAHQLVTVLQQMAHRNRIQEVSTQTSPAELAFKQQQAARIYCTSPKEPEMSIAEIEGSYFRHKRGPDGQRLLPYRSLEDKITVLQQEFNARVNAEVALQVSRSRESEINAARTDEAARYRRRLARDREELEGVHKACMDRIKVCEESLLERIQCKEQAIEASAYEQRQRLLTEISGLRERENKLWEFKEAQERREENLDERELWLRAKEDEVVRVRRTLYALADDITAMRKELEEQYRELCDSLRRDPTLLKAEPEQMTKEKAATSFELAASGSDKRPIQALRWRGTTEEDQCSNLVQTIRELEGKFKLPRVPAAAEVSVPNKRLEERLLDLQAELEQERLQRQASEKALERSLQRKKVELAAARSRQEEWIAEHKTLMTTVHQQEAELRRKQEERDRAMSNLEILQVQHASDERELFETITLLRKAQQALEAEQFEHCAVPSHENAVVPSASEAPQWDLLSRDQRGQNNKYLLDHKYSVDDAFRKKWGSSRTKPQGELRGWYPQMLSDNAAKGASRAQDFKRNPVDYFPTLTMSPPFSSGIGYELELRDDCGITSLTNTEPVLETVVNGALEDYYTSSWNQKRYAEHRFEDAVPSWRKTCVSEGARPVSWNEGYDELVTDTRGVVTNLQGGCQMVDAAGCSSSRDSGSAWNPGARQNESSGTVKSASIARRVHRDCHTMGNKCLRGLASCYNIPDVLSDQEREYFELNQEKPFSKRKGYSATSNMEEAQSQTIACGFTTSTNSQTSMDRSPVKNNNFERDSKSSGDQENHKTNSRTNLELTHVEKQGAKNLCNLSLREPGENISLHRSGAEENLSQDSPSCKQFLNLKSGIASLRVSIRSRDEMDSHSKGDNHKTVDPATDVPKNPTMMPEVDNMQPLDAARNVHSLSSEQVKERIDDNQQFKQRDIESKAVKGKTTQGDETRELDATDEPQKLTNTGEDNAVAVSSLHPNVNQTEQTASSSNQTLFTGDSDIAQVPDKDLTQNTRSLRSPKKFLQKKYADNAFSRSLVSSQKEESRRFVRKNQLRTSEKMSGLTEIGQMLFKKEMHSAREIVQMNLQDSTQVPPGRAGPKGNRGVSLDSSQASKLPGYDKHALESLRTSIVTRKQGLATDKEVGKERSKASKTHPILALAIRNDQLVKLEKQEARIPREGRNAESLLSQAHSEIIIKSTLTSDETRSRTETPRLVTESLNVPASEPTHTPAPHQNTHSSTEESIYEDDSFEEDEEEERVDLKPMNERKEG